MLSGWKRFLIDIAILSTTSSYILICQTCRTLHILSNSKNLWMSLLSRLDYDHAPDVLPHVDLGTLRTEEIKKLVVRATRGYRNWHSPGGPRVIDKRVFQFPSSFYPKMMLAGCDYMLVKSVRTSIFGVWSIEQEVLVSLYDMDDDRQSPTSHCAILKGGDIARLALLYSTSDDADK